MRFDRAGPTVAASASSPFVARCDNRLGRFLKVPEMVWPYTTGGDQVDNDAQHEAEARLYEIIDTVPLTRDVDRVAEDEKEVGNA